MLQCICNKKGMMKNGYDTSQKTRNQKTARGNAKTT